MATFQADPARPGILTYSNLIRTDIAQTLQEIQTGAGVWRAGLFEGKARSGRHDIIVNVYSVSI